MAFDLAFEMVNRALIFLALNLFFVTESLSLTGEGLLIVAFQGVGLAIHGFLRMNRLLAGHVAYLIDDMLGAVGKRAHVVLMLLGHAMDVFCELSVAIMHILLMGEDHVVFRLSAFFLKLLEIFLVLIAHHEFAGARLVLDLAASIDR